MPEPMFTHGATGAASHAAPSMRLYYTAREMLALPPAERRRVAEAQAELAAPEYERRSRSKMPATGAMRRTNKEPTMTATIEQKPTDIAPQPLRTAESDARFAKMLAHIERVKKIPGYSERLAEDIAEGRAIIEEQERFAQAEREEK